MEYKNRINAVYYSTPYPRQRGTSQFISSAIHLYIC
jgi:hypothetical protein